MHFETNIPNTFGAVQNHSIIQPVQDGFLVVSTQQSDSKFNN